MNQEKFLQQAQLLCDVGLECYTRGWSPATSSNYSVRFDDTHCALTSSGKHKGKLTPQDILLVNWQGEAQNIHSEFGKPSAETLLHTQLYELDSNIGAVLHTHSPNSVMLSQFTQQDHIIIKGWELLKALSGITTHDTHINVPIFENTQDIKQLAQDVDIYMQQHFIHAYLIKGHGIYTWGKDLDECMRHLEALDSLMQYELTAMSIK